jgi:hypothetical protein
MALEAVRQAMKGGCREQVRRTRATERHFDYLRNPAGARGHDNDLVGQEDGFVNSMGH